MQLEQPRAREREVERRPQHPIELGRLERRESDPARRDALEPERRRRLTLATTGDQQPDGESATRVSANSSTLGSRSRATGRRRSRGARARRRQACARAAAPRARLRGCSTGSAGAMRPAPPAPHAARPQAGRARPARLRKEVSERHERERDLGLGRPTGQNAVALLARPLDGREPDGRLADAGLTSITSAAASARSPSSSHSTAASSAERPTTDPSTGLGPRRESVRELCPRVDAGLREETFENRFDSTVRTIEGAERDLLVRQPRRHELGDPSLRLAEVVAARGAARDARELAGGLLSPERRSERVEEVERQREGVARRAPLLQAALQAPQREERARPLEGVGRALVLRERIEEAGTRGLPRSPRAAARRPLQRAVVASAQALSSSSPCRASSPVHNAASSSRPTPIIASTASGRIGRTPRDCGNPLRRGAWGGPELLVCRGVIAERELEEAERPARPSSTHSA